ncbi:MAG: ComF family protein [Bacteroidota bacterium]|nr:ComF family protein [Bacteroidota bacterium]
MISRLQTYLKDFSHLLFPHYCEGCGTDTLSSSSILCAQCSFQLPVTNFTQTADNPVEKTFFGRVHIEKATAAFYFTKDSLLQQLLIELKYRNHKEAGIYLGKLLGHQLQQSDRFSDIDALVPLPLNPKKEQKRGYNQAEIICKGIHEVWNKPILTNVVTRVQFTETQTKQDRVHRWQNMKDVFAVTNRQQITGKHILLVDDVVTTGATLEACAAAMQKDSGTTISIATVAYTI